ncbi:iron-containing redox enzyme family protein [Corallococcus sp. AB050B]|nr:iron-containing redox enzyme family protein [Corallococcus sp. AB050B]
MTDNTQTVSGLEALKHRRSQVWDELLSQSRFVRTIQQGEVTKALYALYLIETYHYTRHNARNQALVGVRCDDDRHYQKFCFNHAEEEVGHEQMALHDVASMGLQPGFPIPRALPATDVLIAYLYWVSYQGNPLQRLGYSFWAESCYDYIRPLLGKVQKSLGLTPAQMTFFVAHSDIDAEHSQAVDEMIAKKCKTPEDWEDVAQVMETSLRLTWKMMDEVADAYAQLVDGRSDRAAFLKAL